MIYKVTETGDSIERERERNKAAPIWILSSLLWSPLPFLFSQQRERENLSKFVCVCCVVSHRWQHHLRGHVPITITSSSFFLLAIAVSYSLFSFSLKRTKRLASFRFQILLLFFFFSGVWWLISLETHHLDYVCVFFSWIESYYLVNCLLFLGGDFNCGVLFLLRRDCYIWQCLRWSNDTGWYTWWSCSRV